MGQHQARFSGVARLFSTDGAERLRRAHVCVVGIGGVGSWAVEALARSGIGELTLADLDAVCITNVNRQLHAVTGEFGRPKVEVMARRVQLINPECRIHPLQSFFLASNAEEILRTPFDYVIDAIDSPSRKALLIRLCREKHIPVVTTGAAGGRRDPASIEVTDLAFSTHDSLLRYVRKLLRQSPGFPKGDQPLGVECVFSRERVVYAKKDGSLCLQPDGETDFRLDCSSGFGTAAFVTGTFGFIAASRVVQRLASDPPLSSSRRTIALDPTSEALQHSGDASSVFPPEPTGM
jgi:tRNA threonylcarbamoyladenosine dehydratase